MVHMFSQRLAILFASFVAASAPAQVCEVDTRVELEDALSNPACDHIRIVGTTLVIDNDDVRIQGPGHDGLHLEIVGTVTFTGTPGGGQMFNLVDCSNVLVDGGGTLTSGHDPEVISLIARAFRVDHTSNVTIRNLNFSNLTTAVEGEQDQSTNLVVEGIRCDGMSRYMVYTTHTRSTVTVRDCHSRDTGFHGVRLYGDNLTVTDCTMYGNDGNSLWIVHENSATSWADVARVSSQQRMTFGPDHGTGSGQNARRHNIFAHDLVSPHPNHVRIEMGVIGGCFVDVCSHLWVGRPDEEIVNEDGRPMDRVNWDSILDLTPDPPPNEHVTVVNTPYMTNTAPVTYNWCFADVDRIGQSEHAVDINDLLAVINAWGACPPSPWNLLPLPHCAADVSPEICGDGTVNINDLLLVINTWGGCLANPQCGDEPPVPAGPPQSAPRTISDCWNNCAAAFPQGSQEWLDCFDGCVTALQEIDP